MVSPLDSAPALASQIKMIWDKLDALPTFGWAQVTQVDPLLILRAGDPDGSDVTAIDLIGGLTVGDQVFVVRVARRFFALGRVGGRGVKVCTDFTTAAGWDASQLRVVRDGDLVNVSGAFKQTSGNITAPASYAGGFTLPEGFRPTTTVEAPAFGAASNQVGYAGWAWIDTEGRISFGLTGSGPVNRVVFNLTYPAA